MLAYDPLEQSKQKHHIDSHLPLSPHRHPYFEMKTCQRKISCRHHSKGNEAIFTITEKPSVLSDFSITKNSGISHRRVSVRRMDLVQGAVACRFAKCDRLSAGLCRFCHLEAFVLHHGTVSEIQSVQLTLQ